jgi:transcription elongation factor GreA
MQTPYRKPSKFSYIKPDPQLTQAKFDELKNKLDRLQNKTRFKAMEEVRLHAENGDFSENASYQIAKGRLRNINQRILDLENQLKVAVIIKPNQNQDSVQIGSKVTVSYSGKERTYEILGSSETDPVRGIISYTSPLGAALMKHRVGDQVTVALTNRWYRCSNTCCRG